MQVSRYKWIPLKAIFETITNCCVKPIYAIVYILYGNGIRHLKAAVHNRLYQQTEADSKYKNSTTRVWITYLNY